MTSASSGWKASLMNDEEENDNDIHNNVGGNEVAATQHAVTEPSSRTSAASSSPPIHRSTQGATGGSKPKSRSLSVDYSVCLVSLDEEEEEEERDKFTSACSSTTHPLYWPAEQLPLLFKQGTKRKAGSFSPLLLPRLAFQNHKNVHQNQQQKHIQQGQQNEFLVPISNEAKERPPDSPYYHQSHHTMISPQYRRLRYEQRKQLFSCCLAALSGFADVLCQHSFGCYGNMMTGNTIRLLDHLAAGRWSAAAYPAVLVPSYIVGAALCTYLNKLDLTILGLGGPSQQAFAHLNPPRRLRSPQSIAVLRFVAVASCFLFLLGETLAWLVRMSTTSTTTTASTDFDIDRWRLPFFACAFGLLNAATLAAIHLVTNAVTGHWITVGLGVADDLPVLLNRQSSRGAGDNDDDDDDDAEIPEDSPHPKTQPPRQKAAATASPNKQWKSSMSVAASFIGSIIVTSLLYNENLREMEYHPHWPLVRLSQAAPPMGVVFAIVYTTILYWYTLPPPFLRGYSSRLDLLASPRI